MSLLTKSLFMYIPYKLKIEILISLVIFIRSKVNVEKVKVIEVKFYQYGNRFIIHTNCVAIVWWELFFFIRNWVTLLSIFMKITCANWACSCCQILILFKRPCLTALIAYLRVTSKNWIRRKKYKSKRGSGGQVYS